MIPLKLRSKLIDELHHDHPGMSRMKSVARSYMWWPGLDKQIEQRVRGCVSCQAVKNAPPAAALQPWTWPSQPWKRVHLDFAGPFEGSMFLVAVDACSKWPEIHPRSSTTVTKTIECMAYQTRSLQTMVRNSPRKISQHSWRSMGLDTKCTVPQMDRWRG